MTPHQLLLLSTYRLPTDSALYLGDDEAAAFLNGYLALWHPAALACAEALPRIASPHDHEVAAARHVYVIPDSPSATTADSFPDDARAAGGLAVTATTDRAQTVANLLDALRPLAAGDERLGPFFSLTPEQVAPFVALGFGYLILGGLFEAMQHENVLPTEELQNDLSAALEAIGDREACRVHLQSAAERLLAAREVVYPVTLHLLDLCMPGDGPEAPWPAALEAGLPVNVIATAELLRRVGEAQPERLAQLRERVAAGQAEVLGGGMVEREDPLLPLSSQLWNLIRGQAAYQDLLGQEPRVFARRRTAFHAQSPLLLHSAGYTHALLMSFDEAVLPSHHAPVVSWPSHDGKSIDGFTRLPQPADSEQTYFHLAHHLHQTIMQDQTATLALLHKDKPAPVWYGDWLELTRMAPVLGQWTTLSGYFNEVTAGDYAPAATPDEIQADYLIDRTTGTAPPISGFAAWQRGRRNLDAAYTFQALLRSLGGNVAEDLSALEDRFELGQPVADELSAARDRAAEALARRLLSRPQGGPGWLVLNPCSFTRRVAVELAGMTGPVPIAGPIKACQVEGDIGRVVVEVPPLGFAWVPKQAGAAAAPTRLRMADDRCVRNEFLEAEIDPQTGGLRAIRDVRTRVSRLGQQLVFNPGSTMKMRAVHVGSSGPALGEITTEGDLLDDEGQLLATYRQRLRAWLGRPMIEMRIELAPAKPVEGYAWHSYYGSRFAWRDDGAPLSRGSSGLSAPTSQTRPETPDFLQLHQGGRHNTGIFPGGLPFHQRHGTRMLDVVLIAEGETATAFELGISLDREQPMQTALGMTSPVGVVACEQGPPHVGASGWLYHIDAPNALLLHLRPAAGEAAGVVATLAEVAGHAGQVEMRCARDPARAAVQGPGGEEAAEAEVEGDAVRFELGANDLVRLRVSYG